MSVSTRATPDAYQTAQKAMADLKSAIYMLLAGAPADGLRNVDVGHALGIYTGHVGHEGHVSRTILALMEAEGVVMQESSDKKWSLCEHPKSESDVQQL